MTQTFKRYDLVIANEDFGDVIKKGRLYIVNQIISDDYALMGPAEGIYWDDNPIPLSIFEIAQKPLAQFKKGDHVMFHTRLYIVEKAYWFHTEWKYVLVPPLDALWHDYEQADHDVMFGERTLKIADLNN